MVTRFALAVSLIFCSSVWSQEAICPADYYPLTIGAQWTYLDEENAESASRIVTGIEAGLIAVDDDLGLITYWSSDGEGLMVHKFYLPDEDPERQWSYLEPPITRFPYSMEAGRAYTDTSFLNNPGLPVTTIVQFTGTFEAIEDRFVEIEDVQPGRTYPLCARMVTRQATESSFLGQTIMSTIIESTEWWAWGIGPVEQQLHVVTWDILSGETEEWSNLELLSSNLIEDNPPDVQVLQPTTEPLYGTDAESITVSGTASDDSRVMRIGWEDDHGHSGLAAMNVDWQVADIPLSDGKNVITLTAWDSCGNTSTDVITVFRISIAHLSVSQCHEGESLEGVQLNGSGFPEDALVELRHDGETIAATNVQVSGGGTLMTFDVDFQNSGARSWDIVVKHSLGAELARLQEGFRTFLLAVTEITGRVGSGIAISWTSLVDRGYEVWAAPELEGEWEHIASVPSQGEVTNWENSSALESARGFYRISPVSSQ